MNFVNNLGIVTPSDFSEVGITNGLIGWWPLNGNANDITEYRNNGTVSGATIATGVDDLCYSFDGSSRISIATILLGNGNIAWSSNVWIKTNTAVNALGQGSILSNSSSGPVYSMMGVNSGKIVYWTYQNSDWSQKLGIRTVNDSVWHMLTWVNYTNYTMDMYVDGILDMNISNSTSGNNNPIDDLGHSWSTGFVGLIDDVRIYNRTLTAQEVKIQYELIKNKKMHITNENKLYIAGKLNEVY